MLINNLTSNWPSWIAYGLPSGTELSFNLYAVNSKGRSRSEVLTIATAALPESMNRLARGQVWQFSFSPFLAILITVVSVIVIVALLIIMILKMCPDSSSRTRRKKKNGKFCMIIFNWQLSIICLLAYLLTTLFPALLDMISIYI